MTGVTITKGADQPWEDKVYLMAKGLEKHIADYIPKGWCVDVKNVCGKHYITEKDAVNFLNFFQEGKEEMLEEKLKNYKTGDFNEEDFQSFYVREAIVDFYARRKHEPILRGEIGLITDTGTQMDDF